MNHATSACTVALTVLALEVGTTVDALVTKLGNAAVTYNDVGLRCVSTDAARAFITAHRAAQQEARDREVARREEARRRGNPLRDRVKALAAAQAPFHGDDLPALARVLADTHENRPLDERFYPPGAPLTYHPIRQQES